MIPRKTTASVNRPLAWILGAGVSGEAAAKLLLHRGWCVTVFDGAPEERIAKSVGCLRAEGAEVVCRAVSLLPETPTLTVVSPGLSPDAPLRDAAEKRDLPVVSELELGFRHLRSPMIAVTGSKGKSSLVKVIADTLGRAGLVALPGGNYGTALCTLAEHEPPPAWAIVECSSFQLETVSTFRPRIGILLNLSPDHLDRHGTMEAYRAAKLRLFAQQRDDDVALLPSAAADGGVRAAFSEGCPHAFESFGAESGADWRYVPGSVIRAAGKTLRVNLQGSPFDNEVLGPAAAAGVAALWHAGLSAEEISSGFRSYVPLEHRMQPVAKLGGVRFVNDSKATSLTALRAAVRMVSGPIRLIAGGRLKEKISPDGKELLTSGVRKAYLIGECAGEMAVAWGSFLAVEVCGSLECAVERAGREAEPGETVLLSPGTASFDQFQSFQERGNVFMDLVRRLVANRTVVPEEKSE